MPKRHLVSSILLVLLPMVTIALLFAANDKALLGAAYANGFWSNFFTLFIVGVTCFLGLNNIWRAINEVGQFLPKEAMEPIWGMAGVTLLVLVYLGVRVFGKGRAETRGI